MQSTEIVHPDRPTSDDLTPLGAAADPGTLESEATAAEEARNRREWSGPVLGRPPFFRRLLTTIVAVAPVFTGVYLLIDAIGKPFPWRNLLILAVFYTIMGHAITIGFHRLFTHKSFVAARPLKITLAILGSMAFQGSLIGWVADHRRHHRYPDRPGDPHSPLWRGNTPVSGLRGLWHAHAGWFFDNEPSPREEYAPDLLTDPDLIWVDRMFVPCCVLTLALPAAIGFAFTGTLSGFIGGLLWGGVLRIGLSHNFTWSINSVCHRFGKRPFRTNDVSTNFAPLALLTAGESWHNTHHAFPTLARHGVDRFQLDTSARLIRLFERLGWVTKVRWPDPKLLDARRVTADATA